MDRLPRRACLACIPAALCLVVPAAATPTQAGPRVDVRWSGPALPEAGPASAAEVRALLSGLLSPAVIDTIVADSDAVRALSRLAAHLRSPAGRAVQVRADARRGRDGTLVVRIERSSHVPLREGPADAPSKRWMEVPQGSVVLSFRPDRPRPSPPAPPFATTPQPVAPLPLAIPRAVAPVLCAPGDSACWQDLTRDELSQTPLACESYARELDAHLQRMDAIEDPNGGQFMGEDELNAPRETRKRRNEEVAGQYPSGMEAPDPMRDPIHIKIINGPPRHAPRPDEPSGACRAEWSAGPDEVPPTLACTRALENWANWVRKDPVTQLYASPLKYILPDLPILSEYMAAKAAVVDRMTGWKDVWVGRFVEGASQRLARGDLAWIDGALDRSIADRETRMLLSAALRRHLAAGGDTAERRLADFLFQERYGVLYPDSVDAGGWPALDAFPVRLWWATNWLATTARRQVPLAEALARLRCSPDAERGVRILKDLAPSLAARPRIGGLAIEIEALR